MSARDSRCRGCRRRRWSLGIQAGHPGIADVNAVVGGYLRDLAFAQSSQQKMFGYKRAAAAILALDVPLTDLVDPDGALPRISGIGPGSTRVIREILETGGSPTVERAIEESGRRADIERRRQLRRHFLSRAEVRRVLADPAFAGPTHCSSIAATCKCTPNGATATRRCRRSPMPVVQRGYQYAAVTDHSYGLKIAGGMSMAEAAEQRKAIDDVNARARQSVQAAAGHRSEHRRRGPAGSHRR